MLRCSLPWSPGTGPIGIKNRKFLSSTSFRIFAYSLMNVIFLFCHILLSCWYQDYAGLINWEILLLYYQKEFVWLISSIKRRIRWQNIVCRSLLYEKFLIRDSISLIIQDYSKLYFFLCSFWCFFSRNLSIFLKLSNLFA